MKFGVKKLQCESKKVAPKTFCNIFTLAKYITMKFCQFVASLNPHIFANFGRFNLIFNKKALIFLDFIANDEWPQFTQLQYTGLSDLGQCWSLITSCNKS